MPLIGEAESLERATMETLRKGGWEMTSDSTKEAGEP